MIFTVIIILCLALLNIVITADLAWVVLRRADRFSDIGMLWPAALFTALILWGVVSVV